MEESSQQTQVLPTPRPRRQVIIENEPTNNKTAYENVSIDIINKNINIKDENLQNNNRAKLQNNKTFMASTNSLNDEHRTKVITELNDLHSDKNKNRSSLRLDETNKLSNIYDLDENNKKPVPAPRRSASKSAISSDEKGSGSYDFMAQSVDDVDEGASTSKHRSSPMPTGAFKKVPETSTPDSSPKNNNERMMKFKGHTGNYNYLPNDNDYLDTEMKSLSCSSLNSSQSSNSDPSNAKFNTSSPGQLLKTLGATSKLLTESITERMASRTKDAKHKIDKLHKQSLDRIAETTKSATSKLKNVRRNFNDIAVNNLSLGRSHKKDNNANASKIPEFDPERPQTLPASDEIFHSIKFHSPLSSKTNNCMNINTAESSYEIPRSIRSNSSDFASSSSSFPTDPPSYDEIMSSSDVSKKSSSSLSSSSDAAAGGGPPPLPALRNKNKNPTNQNETKNENQLPAKEAAKPKTMKERNDTGNVIEDEYSVPCPNFPAPVLEEGIYGRLRKELHETSSDEAAGGGAPVCPPVRAKRRKDYEGIKIRDRPESSVESNRATADSNEFKTSTERKFPEIFNRDISADFSEKIRLEEKVVPNPSRSESWSYYEGNDDSDGRSTPEPIYANEQSIRVIAGDEPVYGVLYNIDSPEHTLLTPEAIMRKRKSEEIQRQMAEEQRNKIVEKNLGLDEPSCSTEIIKEFDPLDRTTYHRLFANKSNELILLENMLAEETYGTCTEDNNFDYHSSETSDEEETNVIPRPPARLDSLQEDQEQLTSSESTGESQSTSKQQAENRPSVIIHQNLKLRSDSSENIVDETNLESFLINKDGLDSTVVTDSDLNRPQPSKSHWFLGNVDAANQKLDKSKSTSAVNCKSDKSHEKVDKKALLGIFPKDEKCPPPYSEAIAEDSASLPKPATTTSSDKRSSSTKTSMKSMFSNVMNKMEGIKRKTSFRSNAAKNEVKTVLEMIPRPCLTQRHITHEGHLIRLPCGVVEDILKELHARKAYIRDRKFQAYCDKDIKTPKENIPLEYITTIQCVSNHKFTNNSVEMYCFEITTAIPKNSGNNLSNPNMIITSNNSGNTKNQRVCHLYGVAKESERFIWMQKLLDSITDVFQPGHTCQFYRAGWCYLKNSITSKWSGAWILLQKQKRKLHFYSYLDMNLECMDLRKARCLVLKESDDSINNLHVERGPTLMIDCPPYSMYLIMTSPRETKIWRHIIQEVAHNNSSSLKGQQLTPANVPVLVDKCINFIYAHGSMSEGIYRKSGSENSINKLLSSFRTDAYSVQITRSEYNEHDVANTLKRFMRDLPDRLLGKYSTSFISVSEMSEVREKISAYKELLTRLPTIEFFTLKKLIGHLNFIQSQKSHNKMDVQNLAIVWGPTLLQNKQIESHYSQKEADVIIDLISLYKNLYQLTPDEIAKEQIMLSVLQKYHAAAENLSDAAKKSGDLKVWITVDPNPENETEEKQQINVTLTPNKTVQDICRELAPKMKREAFSLTLSEIILNGTLQRPLHHSEKVFDIVLKWSYWPEADRKNNFLRLRPTKFMKEVERALKMLPIVSPNKELKFADCKSRSFKSYTLELSDGKITVMKKEKSTIVKVREIDLTKATAYLGCEKKRDFQLRWAITLIESNADSTPNIRNKESPFIGHVIAGTNSNDQIVWYSSIMHSLYGDSIMPNPEIILA